MRREENEMLRKGSKRETIIITIIIIIQIMQIIHNRRAQMKLPSIQNRSASKVREVVSFQEPLIPVHLARPSPLHSSRLSHPSSMMIGRIDPQTGLRLIHI